MVKMRNKKQNGLQTEKMNPNAVNSYKILSEGSQSWSCCLSCSQPSMDSLWPTVLVCPGLRHFLGHRISVAKTKKVQGKIGQVGYPASPWEFFSSFFQLQPLFPIPHADLSFCFVSFCLLLFFNLCNTHPPVASWEQTHRG